MNQKGFLSLVLIGVIVVLAGIGGYFVIWSKKSNQPNQQQISTTTTSISTDWETYTNDMYGFEFKYPDIYQTVILSKSSVPNELFRVNLMGPDTGQYGGPRSYIGISVWSNPQKLSLADWASNKDNQSFSNYYNPDPVNNVNGSKNEIISGHNALSYPWVGENDGTTVLIEKDKTIFLLDTISESKNDRVWQDFKEVLSTFKFTK